MIAAACIFGAILAQREGRPATNWFVAAAIAALVDTNIAYGIGSMCGGW